LNLARSCDLCGAVLRPHLSRVRDPQSEEVFDVYACSACGLGHTEPAPRDVSAYYSDGYYGERHAFTARYCAFRRVRILESAMAGVSGALLDIGCGQGTFLAAAAKRGFRVVGTELGAAAERARLANIEVRSSLDDVGDCGPFDAITMWHTLEHFRSPSATVATAASLLREGGMFIVAVPDAGGLQARAFGRHWFHLDVPRHLFHFDAESLERLLVRAGFELERWHHQELEYDLFGWMQSALNAVLDRDNVLFQALSGKPVDGGRVPLPLHYVLGGMLAPAALAATALGTAARRGGTLIAVARLGERRAHGA
jgi:2-polyprenyl-3-methyl-5-hydroxy-6-metoxy-1,4-benzoquinol methylase